MRKRVCGTKPYILSHFWHIPIFIHHNYITLLAKPATALNLKYLKKLINSSDKMRHHGLLYSYQGILVKRVDLGKGMIELVAMDKNHTRHSVLALGLREAMKKVEQLL